MYYYVLSSIYMYVQCPECLSHPAVPWDHLGIFGNVLLCTIIYLVYTCTYSVQSVCPIPLYYGTTWDSLGMYYYVLSSIYMYVQCPECLSHPAVLWDHLGILGNVLICTIYIHVQCPECLSHPAVLWDRMGILGNV